MIKLYQFPISHYCEKIRWTLDYKKLDHQLVNMVPGLHINQTKKMGLGSAVPILQNESNFIQGSVKIIDYLDKQFPQNPLTPNDEKLKSEVFEWENYLDKEVGVNVRLCVYNILLEHPEIVKPFFTHNGPWYGKLFLAFAYPKLKSKMRYFMKINDETSLISQQTLSVAVDRLNKHYQNNQFLVGDEFTRADLSAAALLAPLTMPKQYGLDWPGNIPVKLQNLIDEFSDRISWVNGFYNEYR